jgi:hypothetical protein
MGLCAYMPVVLDPLYTRSPMLLPLTGCVCFQEVQGGLCAGSAQHPCCWSGCPATTLPEGLPCCTSMVLTHACSQRTGRVWRLHGIAGQVLPALMQPTAAA